MSRDTRPSTLETEEQLGPFARSRVLQRPAFDLSWRDGGGTRSQRLSGKHALGSRPGLELRVDDPAVSRLHAELSVRPDGVWVRDLGSRNGTFVEDVLVAHARIPEGGQLRVGTTTLHLQLNATPESVPLWPNNQFGELLGQSDAMRELFGTLSKVSASDAPVIIQGETGSGKEMVARALHASSDRADKPFVVVDCAALPDNLMEAELFGHVRGAFTGASSDRAGALEEAEGGTVFLDEIGELPLTLQPKLLRALESRRCRRLGANLDQSVDVRFLFATHRDLLGMVTAGTFREDLYFRMAVLLVTIPPLRARPEDVPLLIKHFLPPRTDPALAAQLVQALRGRHFAGNVRELRNAVLRAVALGSDAVDTQPPGLASERDTQPELAVPSNQLVPYKQARDEELERFEKAYLTRLLSLHEGNVSQAAEAAGIDRTYLYRLIQRHKR